MVLGRVTRMGSVEIVDAGSEEQILALGQLRVDGGGGVVVRVGDVEPVERDGACPAWCRRAR